MNKYTQPIHITFTGIDDNTDLEALVALDQKYPIEWGILFHPAKDGNRYPSQEFYWEARKKLNKIAVHLCSKYALDIANNGIRIYMEPLVDIISTADRIQLNLPATKNDDLRNCSIFSKLIHKPVILQCRDEFPDDPRFDWLFDQSGGKGKTPDRWPTPLCTPGRVFGFAGGISPDNINATVNNIRSIAGSAWFWIDMESGVRDKNNEFNVKACRKICAEVFDID